MKNKKVVPVYVNGIKVGEDMSFDLVDVGKHCEGYYTRGCGTISMKGRDHLPNAPSLDITKLNDGTWLLDMCGGPERLGMWIIFLEDILNKLKEEAVKLKPFEEEG